MPVTIRVSAAERVRYTVISGDVSDRDLVGAYRAAIAAPDFDPSHSALVDLRTVGKFAVTSAGIWDPEYRAFREMGEARAWLGLRPDTGRDAEA